MNESDLEIRDAGAKGRGLYTRLAIAQGTRVLAMEGVLLRTADLTDDWLALQVGPDQWLCSRGTHLDDMINHSCTPNLGFLDGSPTLYALRDIAAGEELSFDYSTSLSEEGWSLTCQCGSADCRQVIRAWGALTNAERRRLRPIALAYLRDHTT